MCRECVSRLCPSACSSRPTAAAAPRARSTGGVHRAVVAMAAGGVDLNRIKKARASSLNL